MVAGPVKPGTGWPGDPATAGTPVAGSGAEVRELAVTAGTLPELTARQSVCRACPRLVAWREEVAAVRRRSFRDEQYWGRPIPGWGDAEPAILIVGLAPAAHGGNRTGRVFTGDRSGDFLFAALHRCGLAALPTSVSADDGQQLIGARMVAAVRCAPPENKPTPQERDDCAPWLAAELGLVRPTLRVVVVLGGFAWQALWPVLAQAGYQVPRRRPAFAHGAEAVVRLGDGPDVLVLGCYHPSQQNTFTGRVTPGMLDAIFNRASQARELAAAIRHFGFHGRRPLVGDLDRPQVRRQRRGNGEDLAAVAAPEPELGPPGLIRRRDKHDGTEAVLPRELRCALRLALRGGGIRHEAEHARGAHLGPAQLRRDVLSLGEDEIAGPVLQGQTQRGSEPVSGPAGHDNGAHRGRHPGDRKDKKSHSKSTENNKNRENDQC
jgi:uracil-DNA glycosylase